ncbi:Sperm-specific class P protein 34 [Trichinella pseudospiralis]|uniref:Major sperm protein n=1 Tax=Trichinella pseudospiralis TaxID=6337 RepID=A0A0V1G630_TRIPS|nr:Sperm-specific class P protein 34 [Trichinella pseudospiralis]
MSDRSEISASPTVLDYVYPADHQQRAVLKIKNESDLRLALKIKTTNNSCFKVSFVYAVLEPRGEKKLTVGCAPIADDFTGVRDDKVVVCYTEIPNGEIDVKEFWKSGPPLKALRLPVAYHAQGEQPGEQAVERPREENVEVKKEAAADEPGTKPKEEAPATEPEVKPKVEAGSPAETEGKPKEEEAEGKVKEAAVPSADSEEKQAGGAAAESEENPNAEAAASQPDAKSKEEESDSKVDSSESNASGDEE